MEPVFRIEIGGKDATEAVQRRLLSLSLIDQAGHENDSVTLKLDDRPPHISLPSNDAKMRVWMGYKRLDGTQNVRDMGSFKIDELGYTIDPDVLRIVAHAVSTSSAIKETRTRSWDDITVAEIVEGIAKEHDLIPRVSAEIGSMVIGHLDQVAQSNGSLLTDLAKRYGGIMKVTDDHIYFGIQNAVTSVTGAIIPHIEIDTRNILGGRFLLKNGRAEATGTAAAVFNLDRGEEIEVSVGTATEAVMEVLNNIPTEEEAAATAESYKANLAREEAKGSLKLIGNPSIVAETRVMLVGFRKEVSKEWVAARVQHTIGKDFLTKVDLETPGAKGAGKKASSSETSEWDVNRLGRPGDAESDTKKESISFIDQDVL